MSSLKQLAVEVLSGSTIPQSHSLTDADFASVRAARTRPWKVPSELNQSTSLSAGVRLGHNFGRASQSIRPRIVVCSGFGPSTARAVLRRRLSSGIRILLCFDRLPKKLRVIHRIILTGVDAVLVENEAMARAVRAVGVVARRIVVRSTAGDLASFNRPARSRAGLNPYRILYVGDLEPEAGIADFLPCVVAWANRNPGRDVEICWSGEGCLRGVLEAQPLPDNLVQRFAGETPQLGLPSLFLESDLLAIPALSDTWDDLVAEALTAQLPVLGSCRSRAVNELVVQGINGWIFDPFRPGDMARAVDIALGISSQQLSEMRGKAAARNEPSLPGLDERIWRAMRLEGSKPSFMLGLSGLAR